MTDTLPNVAPLDCPDCGGRGTLRLAWKPARVSTWRSAEFDYRCATPGCRGYLPARRDGSPRGRPGDCETRRLRKALERRLRQLWAVAPILRARTLGHELNDDEFRRACNDGRAAVSRWLAKQLGLETSASRTGQLDRNQVSRALDLCRGMTFGKVARWNLDNPKQKRRKA